MTSFFYVLDGALYTPPLSDRILDSISRRVLLEVTDAQERVTTLDDLPAISEAFLASSLREVQPVRSIDGRAIPAAPGPVSADAAARVREHIEAALSQPREDRHGHRQPAAVRQGGGGVGAAARRARGAARAHRPALRRRAVDDLRHRARRAAAGDPARARRRDEHRADGAHAVGARRRAARAGARRGARLRRHELDARGRARRGAAADPRRARRGRHALVRPRDARGAQPRAHRPRLRAAARPVADRRREPRARGRGGRGRGRRRRHGRRRVAARRRARAPTTARWRQRAWPRASTCSSPRTAPATSTTPPAWRCSSTCCCRSTRRSSCRCTRARARGSRRAGLLDRLAAGSDPAAAARLPRVHVAADARARRADGLRRRAEGGLPRGRAVRDAARHDRVGRDRAVGLERPRRPRRGRAAVAALGRPPPAERPELYGDGHAAQRVVAAMARLRAR